jgi:Replication-relaxation
MTAARAYDPSPARSELSSRDRQVVELVGRLTQASSAHLRSLLFDSVSRVSLDRSLKRLTASQYLVKIGKRAVGAKGGTPPAVYRIGARGHWLLGREGRYRATIGINNHALRVSDLFTELVLLDRQGIIKLLPDTTLEYPVGHSRADMYVDVALPAIGKRRRYFVEVQLSSRADIITKKIEAYWDAYSTSNAQTWPVVVFITWDEFHRYRIKQRMPKRQELFKVLLIDEFISVLTT